MFQFAYFAGALIGALLFVGIATAVSGAIRRSLPKLFIACCVLTVFAIAAEYYGSADGAPVTFPPPMEWWLNEQAFTRIATFGIAFFIFSVPVMVGFWKTPAGAESEYSSQNVKWSYASLPIAIMSCIPMIYYFVSNRPPSSGLEAYEMLAPKTYEFFVENERGFEVRIEEAIGLHRLGTQVLDPQTAYELRAEVEVVSSEVAQILNAHHGNAIRAPAQMHSQVLLSIAAGNHWIAENHPEHCDRFLIEGWLPFAEAFSPISHEFIDDQLLAHAKAVLVDWDGQPPGDMRDDDLPFIGNKFAQEYAPTIGLTQNEAVAAAEAFDAVLYGEETENCGGVADILTFIATDDSKETLRVRAILASAFLQVE